MASLALHNLLRTKSMESCTPIGSIDLENETGEIIEGTLRQEVVSTNDAGLKPAAPCRTSITAEEVQNELQFHFNGPGQIPFQWRVLNIKSSKETYEGNISKAEAHSEPTQTSQIELCMKVVIILKPFTVSAKNTKLFWKYS